MSTYFRAQSCRCVTSCTSVKSQTAKRQNRKRNLILSTLHCSPLETKVHRPQKAMEKFRSLATRHQSWRPVYVKQNLIVHRKCRHNQLLKLGPVVRQILSCQCFWFKCAVTRRDRSIMQRLFERLLCRFAQYKNAGEIKERLRWSWCPRVAREFAFSPKGIPNTSSP